MYLKYTVSIGFYLSSQLLEYNRCRFARIIYSPWGAELPVNGVLSAVGLLGYIQSLGC